MSDWARGREDVAAVALVGSWARGTAREDSDVDLVVLTDTDDEGWIGELVPGAELVRRGNWGAIEERRVRLPSGLEVEIGIGRPSWASTDPLDDGTRRVVEAGFRPLHDPRGLLAALG